MLEIDISVRKLILCGTHTLKKSSNIYFSTYFDYYLYYGQYTNYWKLLKISFYFSNIQEYLFSFFLECECKLNLCSWIVYRNYMLDCNHKTNIMNNLLTKFECTVYFNLIYMRLKFVILTYHNSMKQLFTHKIILNNKLQKPV